MIINTASGWKRLCIWNQLLPLRVLELQCLVHLSYLTSVHHHLIHAINLCSRFSHTVQQVFLHSLLSEDLCARYSHLPSLSCWWLIYVCERKTKISNSGAQIRVYVYI